MNKIYYVNYDATTGQLKGFYNSEMNGNNVPDPFLILTEAQWKDAVKFYHLRKVDVTTKAIIEIPEPTPSNEDLLNVIRALRNEKLTKTDWTLVSDSPLTTEQRTMYVNYRQALRDFPANCDPKNPVWPVEPSL